MSLPDDAALGRHTREPSTKLDTFAAPDGCAEVTFHTDELASYCPVTGQPDYGSVTITYEPDARCLESKSLKLYLWSWRDRSAFVEALAATIADDLAAALEPRAIIVEVRQNVRGGIETVAIARRSA